MPSPSTVSTASPSSARRHKRRRARVLLLARKVENEEDRTRGLIRPLRSTGETLQHAEQSGGRLRPVTERPFRGFLREIIPGAREGLDRGFDVHGKAPS